MNEKKEWETKGHQIGSVGEGLWILVIWGGLNMVQVT